MSAWLFTERFTFCQETEVVSREANDEFRVVPRRIVVILSSLSMSCQVYGRFFHFGRFSVTERMLVGSCGESKKRRPTGKKAEEELAHGSFGDASTGRT